MEKKKKEHSFIYKKPSTWIGRILERFKGKFEANYVIGSPGASIKVYGKSDLVKMYGKEKAIQIIKTAEKSFNENLNNSPEENSK